MKYLVKGGIAEIGTDMVLKLSAAQLAARRHAVEEVKGGQRPTSILQFKSGETIDIVDVTLDKMPRTLSDVLVPEGKAPKSKASKSDLREDGPTIAEFVAAGYPASNYPPAGYASRSTDEEIAAAIAAEEKKRSGGDGA